MDWGHLRRPKGKYSSWFSVNNNPTVQDVVTPLCEELCVVYILPKKKILKFPEKRHLESLLSFMSFDSAHCFECMSLDHVLCLRLW